MPERRNKMLPKKPERIRQAKHAKKNTIDCPRNKMYSKRIFSSSSKKFNSAQVHVKKQKNLQQMLNIYKQG